MLRLGFEISGFYGVAEGGGDGRHHAQLPDVDVR
jgi:hypothetical protein